MRGYLGRCGSGRPEFTLEYAAAGAVTTDVTDPEAMRDLVAAAELEFGGLDVMVNNAGPPHRLTPLVDLDVATMDAQFAVTVRSVALGCKFAVPAAFLYLVSDQAGFLTGVCLDVDGGRSIQ